MTAFFDPVTELLRLQREFENLQRSPTPGFLLGPSAAGVFPHLNIFRNAEGLVVRAELPGVRPEDIAVTAERRRLTISGERKPEEAERGGYHRRERAWGKFSRTIQLPEDLDVERAKAEFKKGVMTLTIPVVAAAKPRQISVQAA